MCFILSSFTVVCVDEDVYLLTGVNVAVMFICGSIEECLCL